MMTSKPIPARTQVITKAIHVRARVRISISELLTETIIINLVWVPNSVYRYMHIRIYPWVRYMQVFEKKVGICSFRYMQLWEIFEVGICSVSGNYLCFIGFCRVWEDQKWSEIEFSDEKQRLAAPAARQRGNTGKNKILKGYFRIWGYMVGICRFLRKKWVYAALGICSFEKWIYTLVRLQIFRLQTARVP